MVPEIWNITDRIFLSCWTNGAWDRECNRQNWHMDYFLPFYPPNNQKNQNF